MSTLSEILESLRLRAEEHTADAATTRRPSWGPALVIGEEFVELARKLGLLNEGDKPIVRLWAQFANPRKRETILREQVGLTLSGVRCRAFDLHVGETRKGTCLFSARRGSTGDWDVGPSSWKLGADYQHWQLRQLVRDLQEQCQRFARTIDECGGPEQQPNMVRDLERMQQARTEREAEYQAAQIELDAKNAVRARLLVLARERVVEFGGGNHLTQMIAGARVTGNCCICGRELTDPVSVERGIGPDCYSKPVVRAWVDAWVTKQQPSEAAA
jgi:hypothetical protein